MDYLIVDTSVWIDFFRGTLQKNDKDRLVTLLDAERIVITDIISHELLVGTNNKADFKRMKRWLSPLQQLSVMLSQHEALAQFGFDLNQKGLLGKYTDLQIAFLSRQSRYPVYSFDKYFSKLAKHRIIKVWP